MHKKDKNRKEEKKPDYEIKHNDRTADFERDILKENNPKFSYLTKLFSYVFNSAKLMCGLFLGLAITLSLLQPVTAFIWGRYIDSAEKYTYTENSNLIWMIFLAVLYWLIGFVSGIIDQYLYGGESIQKLSLVQSNRLQEKFETKLYEKISKLYPEYMEVPKINDIIQRSFDSMGGEWSSLQRGVIIEGYVIIAKIISVGMVALSLYIFNPVLCLIVLIAPIPTLYTTYIGNKLNFKFSRDNGKLLREAGYYQGVLLGGSAKEVKALNLFDFFFNKWKVIADDYVVREKKNQFNIFVLGSVNGVISVIASVSANVLAIILMTQGKLSIGELGAVMALIGTLMGSTSRLFGSIANFISKKNESAQFFEFISLSEEIADDKTENKFEKFEKMKIQNVSYRYPLTDIYRINDVSLTIRKGEKIAFVGENGAGKTTFIKLITGLIEPSFGDIEINGKNTNEISCTSRYDSMSGVFQEPARFNTFTIGDNVFLGDTIKERDDENIENSLTFAGFEGAETNALLGKDIGGTDLSGGQWQKIAIARAYYRNRDFIVLDEPTSNLDPLAETEIFRKYIEMTKEKTVIMVTHRISVASLADRVIVFKDGRIVEDGTHSELSEQQGEYARLYTTQAEWYDR